MKKIFILIPIILFGLFFFFARLGKYKEFHSAEINGKIDTIYRYRDYVMIEIKGHEFRIIPVSLYNSPQLDKIGKIGDEIHKQPNIDNFTLIHDGDEAFSYTVRKY